MNSTIQPGIVSRWSRLDNLLCAAITLAALLVRLPELLMLPVFRDELAEVVRGLHIYRGLGFPLTNEALDIGALFNYMVALLFAGAGPDPYTPRLLVTMLGAATVALTYALARRLSGSTIVAAIAAGLLATNSMHILIGHVSWSNCMTPFWTTATLLALTPDRAWSRPNMLPRPGALILAGLLAGLALQSHSSVVAFLAGLAIWLWWPWRGLFVRLRRPAFWAAHAALLLAYGNMIVFNIVEPLASWYHVVEHKSYALAGAEGAGTVGVGAGYPGNLAALLIEWVRSNSADFATHDEQLSYLADPQFIIYGLLLIVGIVIAVRRKLWLILAPLTTIILILPLFNRDYQFEIHTRYIGFLLPIGAVLMALPFGRVVSGRWSVVKSRQVVPSPAAELSHKTDPYFPPAPMGKGLGVLALPLLIAIPLIIYPLFPLFNYYGEENAAGRSNSSVISILDQMKSLRGGGAAAYTNKLPVAMSIGLGLDVWEIPHVELNDTNEPTLPPGEGGLDSPAVWRSFVTWTDSLPPGTSGITVAVSPAGAQAWRSIGGNLPWSDPIAVSGSDGQEVATVLRLPMSVAELRAQPGAQIKTDLMLIVPRLSDTVAPESSKRISATLAAGGRVRVVVLDGSAVDATSQAALTSLGLSPDDLFLGGYPAAFLNTIAPGTATPDPEAPWTDAATSATVTTVPEGPTIYARLYGHPGLISAASLRADLRGLAVLYTPTVILAPAADSADPLLAVAGKNASYAARKGGVRLEVLP